MSGLHMLHGSAWGGVLTTVGGALSGDKITYAVGIAIAVGSAAVAALLSWYGRVRDERRRQEWLDFELEQKMLAIAKAAEATPVRCCPASEHVKPE